MGKVEVPFDCYYRQVVACLRGGGALLTSLDKAGRPNAMTIGWGTVGIVWGKAIFMALVRPSRYTYSCIEATEDFTVCIPYPDMAEAVMLCGTESGRDHDKFAECGFTPLQSAKVKSPGITECGLVFECDVVHRNDVIPQELAPRIAESAYPSGDFHRMYYGEILHAVADDDFEARFAMA